MPLFRKKTSMVVKAERYVPGQALPEGVKLGNIGKGTGEAYVISDHGLLLVHPMDWVITGIKGERYPCHPEIFAELYEEVPA